MTDIDEARVISFLGVRKDRDSISEPSYRNMSMHKKFHVKAQNLELSVDRYMHSRMTGMHQYSIARQQKYDLPCQDPRDSR